MPLAALWTSCGCERAGRQRIDTALARHAQGGFDDLFLREFDAWGHFAVLSVLA